MERIETILFSLFLLNIFMWITDCCYPGIESIGTVSPLGDINSEVGSDIIINCTLKDDYNGPANASDIRWRRNSTDIPKQFIRVLNNQTAQLHLINTTMEDSGYYSCYVNAGEQSTVCNNDVKIGKPPPGEVNITCLSQNWMNLTCSWSAPYNPVHTKWSFFYRLYKYRLECPEYLNARTGCFFSENTQPPYRPAAKEYYFYLEGDNPLGKNKINFVFDHYQDVLPNPPSDLQILQMGSRQLDVKWNAPKGMQLFPPNLFYQLEYFSDWDTNWKVHSVGLNTTSFMLTSLIPNSNYTVKVCCRSGASETSPWSKPSISWKNTIADVPGAPPTIIAGSFHQKRKSMKRDIYLHWQAIPKILENGNDVSYVIDALEDDLQREVFIQEQSRTSAQINNLELEKMYTFRLQAKNEKGTSANMSLLTVHPAHKLPPKPEYINIISYEGGIYEASWILGEEIDINKVDNFTLFWCESQNNRPGHPCYDSDISWKIIDQNVTAVNLSLSNEKNYQFAFAINIGIYSSGMTWATCIVPHDGVVGKLKSVSVLHNRIHEIELSWRLDCSDRTGIVTGFNVYYCMYNETTQKCLGNQTHQEHYSNPYADRYALMHLKPYTTYKISVSAVTKTGEGEPSDPVINRTREGAPDDQPHLGLSLLSNSTVAVAVQNPQTPNGEIRQFRFFVNNKRWENVTNKGQQEFVLTNLDSYTNYSVQVTACTVGELCSPPSPVLLVTTGVGIPSPPLITKIQTHNATHVRVEWEDPEKANGPITEWIIHIEWKDANSQHVTHAISIPEDGRRVEFIPLPMSCADNNEIHPSNRPEYNISIQAQTTNLEGLPSKLFIIQPCTHRENEVLPLWVIGMICICSLFFVCCLFLLTCRGIRRLKKKLKEIKNIKVQLPKGLDSPNISSLVNFGECKTAFCGSLAHVHGNRSNRKSNDKDIRFSSSSIDELLYSVHGECPESKHDISRMQSFESSGFSTGPESTSSSVTARTHLSLDSGADVEMPSSPAFDCVFSPPADAFCLKTKPDSLPHVHYSQVGHYTNLPAAPKISTWTKPRVELKNSNDAGRYDDDYLHPIAFQPSLTVIHPSVMRNQTEGSSGSRRSSQPCVPPKLKQVPTSSNNGQKLCVGFPETETGYAKVGLSQLALQSARDKRAEELQKKDEEVVFAPTPSMVKEFTKRTMLVSSSGDRTFKVPPVIDRDIAKSKQNNEGCKSGTSVNLGSVPKNPYVAWDELRDSTALLDAPKSSSEKSVNSGSAKSSACSVPTSKTYLSLSQLTLDPKSQQFTLATPTEPVSSSYSRNVKSYPVPTHSVSNGDLFATKPNSCIELQPSTRLNICSKTCV